MFVLERLGVVDVGFDGVVHGVHECVYAGLVVVLWVGRRAWVWHFVLEELMLVLDRCGVVVGPYVVPG
jgi:hypothetical protein